MPPPPRTRLVLDAAWWRPLAGRAWLQLLSAKELRIESRNAGDPLPAISTSLSLAGDVIVAVHPAGIQRLGGAERAVIVQEHIDCLRAEIARMGDASDALAGLMRAARLVAAGLFAGGTLASWAAGPAAGYWPLVLVPSLIGFSPQAVVRRTVGRSIGAYLRYLGRREIGRRLPGPPSPGSRGDKQGSNQPSQA